MKSINTLSVGLGLLLMGLGALPELARADSPTVAPITVQLVDEAGNRIADGFHTLTVSLFDSWESDEPALTETHHEVWVEDGHATVDVGSIRAIPFELDGSVEVSVAVGPSGTGVKRVKLLHGIVVSAYLGPSSRSNDAVTDIKHELPDRWIESTLSEYIFDELPYTPFVESLIEIKTRPFYFREPGLNCTCSQELLPYVSSCSILSVEQYESTMSWLITVENYSNNGGSRDGWTHLVCHGLASPLITVTAP